MKPKLLLPLLLSTLPLSQLSQAAQLEISINNLTHGNHFTPCLSPPMTATVTCFKPESPQALPCRRWPKAEISANCNWQSQPTTA